MLEYRFAGACVHLRGAVSASRPAYLPSVPGFWHARADLARACARTASGRELCRGFFHLHA